MAQFGRSGGKFGHLWDPGCFSRSPHVIFTTHYSDDPLFFILSSFDPKTLDIVPQPG